MQSTIFYIVFILRKYYIYNTIDIYLINFVSHLRLTLAAVLRRFNRREPFNSEGPALHSAHIGYADILRKNEIVIVSKYDFNKR